MPKPRKKFAKNWARGFAAGLVQNAEAAWQQQQVGLSDEEIVIVEKELQRIAARIEATVTEKD